MSDDLILHHYDLSPFSKKVRSMLGYARLPWQSVIVKEMPPRPLLAPLAGGYRKIPVAQDGADVYCDTRVIAEEIAQRSGLPRLALSSLTPEQQQWVARVDLQVFLACFLAAGNLRLGRKLTGLMSAGDLVRFAWDRINLGRTARVSPKELARPRQRVLEHAAQVEQMLAGRDFLQGDAPTHADFSVWHGFWFLNDFAESALLRDFARTQAWMDRMRIFGEGAPASLDAREALAVARAATPRTIAAEHRRHDWLGMAVRVAPTDYGREATEGTLAGETATRWIIAREHPETGLLHQHFPREGFRLNRLGS